MLPVSARMHGLERSKTSVPVGVLSFVVLFDPEKVKKHVVAGWDGSYCPALHMIVDVLVPSFGAVWVSKPNLALAVLVFIFSSSRAWLEMCSERR